MCTCYTCTYTIYTHLNTLYTPYIHPIYTLYTPNTPLHDRYGHIIAKTAAIRLELQKWILEEKEKMTDRDAEFKHFADERRWENGAVGKGGVGGVGRRETRDRDER